ncbi:MAG: TIGR00730 family Rossman fold protein [Fimbriiglobus sp.]
MRNFAVFCGSRSGTNPIYTTAARELGQAIGERGGRLIYGGGRVGLMGVVAIAAQQAGAEVLGFIPEALSSSEIAYREATELVIVETMHERKALMANRAEAFIALPGGYGTCDELFEILTWAQIGYHAKPVALLNTHGFFDLMLQWLDHMQAEGFLRPMHREYLLVADRVDDLFHQLTTFIPKPVALGSVKP